MISFELSEEQQALQEMTARFVKDTVIPRAPHFDETGEYPSEVASQAFELGLMNITIPEDARSISMNADGEIYAYFSDQVQPELLGQVTMALFVNPKGLEAIGSNLFLETGASGSATVTNDAKAPLVPSRSSS